jgi:MYXO-CTERM domain-containing protein
MRNRSVVLTLAAVTLGLSQISSGAFSTVTTYNFTGTCSDCSGTGTATLTLGNYTLGQPITTSNFISLTYNGTNLQGAFTIPTGAPNLSVSGSITTVPGTNNVTVVSSLFNSVVFNSSTTGSWFVGLGDAGTTSVWTAASPTPTPTPAPPTIVLLAMGLLAMAALFWWQRRTA